MEEQPIAPEKRGLVYRLNSTVGREAAHGVIILSLEHGAGWVWLPGRKEPLVCPQLQ